MTKHGQRSPRGRRPQTEALETRQLLAASFRGVDIDGDVWVLRLVGAGDVRVTLQPDVNGDPPLQGQPALIDTITVAGTDPQQSRLIGTVRKGTAGDGKVFFNTLNQLGGLSATFSGSNLGTNVVDMPHFWLGQTGTGTSILTPSIDMPFGVNTLRFGGVDVTYAAPGVTPPSADGANDTFQINLGTPFTYGTSIVVDHVISSAQPGATPTATPFQDAVVFEVAGRLNTFQANQISGNGQIPPTGFLGGGGTIVRSVVDEPRQLTGQIGFLRVGGNATNFSVQTNDRVSNFYIGGETTNVFLLAPQGSRSIQFGRGMDSVTIRSLVIETLQANRGAIGSDVMVTDKIGRIAIGGDVVNTIVQAGYQLQLDQVFQVQSDFGDAPAKSTGAINNVLIAGDVVDSIFAASVEPFEGQFDVPQALFFPHAHIKAKVEGQINNVNTTPFQPNQAFYATDVVRTRGPVNPPNVVEPPFPHPFAAPSGPRISKNLLPSLPPRRVQPAPMSNRA